VRRSRIIRGPEAKRGNRKAVRPMITIPLTTEDLTKVRLAPSPLWETVNSFGVLLHHGRDTVHAPWAARARRTLPGTDLSPLLAAMCLEKHCPDFLSPPPYASDATFDEELERLRITPPEVVYAEVEDLARAEEQQFGPLPPEKDRLLRTFRKSPEVSLKKLVDSLRRYHDLAISPYWSRMREHVEGDTLRRGQALALGGVEALLSGLHPKAGYAEGVLTLDKTYEAVVDTAGRGITLVPCIFVWPRVDVLVQPGYRPTLAYPPRGAASLWMPASPLSHGTALGAALGDSRASVLKGLISAPTTTTELSRQLRLAPAAVSAHLTRLKAAGLVEPHRSGRKVYYRLSCSGESLLEVFGETG
jgi:DNA-binding transcriptional ArsR family regulator